MDWKRCIICQKSTGESLQCLANSKRKNAGTGYVSFVHNVEEFQRLGIKATDCEPPIDEQTLLQNKVCWHKSCRDRFNNTKLQREKKRRLDEDSEVERHEVEETISSSPVKARRSSVGRYNSQTLCFFCDDYDSSSNLHCASTLNVDKKVRDCAVLLNDRKRIA